MVTGASKLMSSGLVIGETPAGLAHRVAAFVEAHQLGAVFGQDTGFRIANDPDTVRAPDLAFVGAERLPSIPRSGYASLAPDLVAEIRSTADRPGELLAKVADWIAAGVRLVWVIDPDRGVAQIHRDDGSLTQVDIDGRLDGEDVLPGFGCGLRSILIP